MDDKLATYSLTHIFGEAVIFGGISAAVFHYEESSVITGFIFGAGISLALDGLIYLSGRNKKPKNPTP